MQSHSSICSLLHLPGDGLPQVKMQQTCFVYIRHATSTDTWFSWRACLSGLPVIRQVKSNVASESRTLERAPGSTFLTRAVNPLRHLTQLLLHPISRCFFFLAACLNTSGAIGQELTL
jgi:hypothetical protein